MNNIMALSDKVIASTYARLPVAFVKGDGCTLYDTDGKQYTDFVSGIAVCNLGHARSDIADVIYEQAKKLVHVSNLYYTEPQALLAAWLVEKSFADKVFFANSGAEANEAAIKLCRKYFADKKESRPTILTMQQSFHGRTMATLTATGQDKIKEGFLPVLPGFDYVPFNDIQALAAKMDDSIAAVMVEPVQGEGGIVVPDPDYFKQVRQLCDAHGSLLIFDEIQTGMGRTGKCFGYEHQGVEPDIMTLAKALGNGLPIGAMLAKASVMQAFGPGSHASTFGGTPLVTAAALEVCRIFDRENIVDQAKKTGDYFKHRLIALKDKYDIATEVRGLGLLLGIRLNTDGIPVMKKCLEKGFVINCVQGDILRFVPPLTITQKEIDSLIECLDTILKDM